MEMDALLAAEKACWDALSDKERAHNARMDALRSRSPYVEATNTETGIRSRFHFTEAFNLGPGWMMTDIDERHKGVVSSFKLAEVSTISDLGPLIEVLALNRAYAIDRDTKPAITRVMIEAGSAALEPYVLPDHPAWGFGGTQGTQIDLIVKEVLKAALSARDPAA